MTMQKLCSAKPRALQAKRRKDRTRPNYGGCAELFCCATARSIKLPVIFDGRSIGPVSGRPRYSNCGQGAILRGYTLRNGSRDMAIDILKPALDAFPGAPIFTEFRESQALMTLLRQKNL
jgi:hypothetical protein